MSLFTTIPERIENPPNVAPRGWDTTWEDEAEAEWRFGAPMPHSLMPCGCYLRRPDYEAVLCKMHLAELNGLCAVCGRTTDPACWCFPLPSTPAGGTDD